MNRELKALGAGILTSGLALGGAFVFGKALQQQARADSHQLPPPAVSGQGSPPMSTPEMVAAGRKLFLNSCAHCHGVDARGDEGPDLHDLQMSDRHIVSVIKTGFKDEMPSFAKKHSDAEISEILAYVRSLKDDPPPADAAP
ncbi:MAG TPA: cytochrome c [Opitutales bacterium]|jgi:mono/diheme cytochrome c family protein|nr:cytochrome c [Opitutales bacterium]